MNKFNAWFDTILDGRRRTAQNNKLLGYCLAFIAGAVNAGGFMLIGQYTSHMTGIASLAADNVAIGNWVLVISLLFYILCFILGAATTTLLVIWGRNRLLHSCYALPIVFEGILLLFLAAGSILNTNGIISLLCFLMGLQNAVITKITDTRIRTTHITGMSTDIGIELGRIIYSIMSKNLVSVTHNKEKILLHISIVSLFLLGGIIGACGFKYIGFIFVFPISAFLFLLAAIPVYKDIKIYKYLQKRKHCS